MSNKRGMLLRYKCPHATSTRCRRFRKVKIRARHDHGRSLGLGLGLGLGAAALAEDLGEQALVLEEGERVCSSSWPLLTKCRLLTNVLTTCGVERREQRGDELGDAGDRVDGRADGLG
eukprot:scaffold30725_cov65-Phaeocystis_antarctica.AAC.1